MVVIWYDPVRCWLYADSLPESAVATGDYAPETFPAREM